MNIHFLRLHPLPFTKIKNKTKTIEMRLFDEEKSQIKVGDLIEFTNRENNVKILCLVELIDIYDNFESLYNHNDKVKLGYKEDKKASYKDMEIYYPLERQNKYHVMAIHIKLLEENDHLYKRYQVSNIFNNDIKLAIFDLDGTLIASTSLWADIDYTFFKRRNMEIPPNYNKEIAHIGLLGAAKLTKEKYLPNENIEDIINEWNSLALEAYQKHIPLKEYALDVLEELHNKGIIIALATANSEELYLPCLQRLDINKYFSLIMDVNSCKEGKDSPEIYDKICDYFHVSRSNTVVFEDMVTALKTAYNNGYYVIGINDKNSVVNQNENKKYCHAFIDTFYDVLTAIKSI